MPYPYQRILIIGCSGAGKSTFARRLHQIFPQLELIYLDRYYWRPGWFEPPKEEWEVLVKELITRENWIMDGGYTGTIHLRAPRADIIYFFDFPTWLCLLRAIKRILSNKLGLAKRPDMTEGCPERFDWEFFHFILIYNQKYKPRILKIFQDIKLDPQKIVYIKNDREVRQILSKLSAESRN